MTGTLMRVHRPPLVLHLRPAVKLSDEQFFQFCERNQNLRIELTAEGDLEILPLADWVTRYRNAGITAQLCEWALRDGTGIVTDSSGGYTLPNGAVRARLRVGA